MQSQKLCSFSSNPRYLPSSPIQQQGLYYEQPFKTHHIKLESLKQAWKNKQYPEMSQWFFSGIHVRISSCRRICGWRFTSFLHIGFDYGSLNLLFSFLEYFQTEWNPKVCVVFHPHLLFLQKHIHCMFIMDIKLKS